jgi:antitoxin component YwqK of YwqJK toxin-antitoxin module
MVLIFSTILLCVSCGQHENTVIIKDENGKIIEKYETSGDSIRSGLSEKFDSNGNLRSTETYLNGLLTGERTIYYPTGEKQIIEHYQLGDFDGLYQFFFQSGQLEFEGNYLKNEMIGDWKRYYTNGQLQEIVRFEGNEENGPFIEYYENGQLKAEGQYYHGDNEHGLLKLYDESGELYRKMECDSGKCHTIWKRGDQD